MLGSAVQCVCPVWLGLAVECIRRSRLRYQVFFCCVFLPHGPDRTGRGRGCFSVCLSGWTPFLSVQTWFCVNLQDGGRPLVCDGLLTPFAGHSGIVSVLLCAIFVSGWSVRAAGCVPAPMRSHVSVYIHYGTMLQPSS